MGMTARMRNVMAAVGLMAAAVVAGCNPDQAVNKDTQTTFLTSTDLVTMTDQMAQSIIADPDVARVVAEKPMVIVVKPIINQTNEIIRKGQKELYVHRLQVLLASKPALRQRFVFVLNKADYQRLKDEEHMSETELGMDETRVQPEYALTGTFYVDTNASKKRRSDTYLCTYRLTKLQGEGTGVMLWENGYETSKSVKKEFLD